MAKKLYDLAVKTGEYTNQQGEKKGRYQNVGAVMQTDDGSKFIMLAKWFNPAGVQDLSGRGGESVLVSIFPPRAQDQGRQAGEGRQRPPEPAPPPGHGEYYDDGLPF